MLTDTIATAAHGPWNGGPGPWFLLFPLFWIAVLVTLGIVFGRRRRQFWQAKSGEGVLRERYARGEIDDEEYRARLGTLRGK